MPTSDAFNRTDRLHQIQLLFWRHPERKLRTIQIAEELGVSDDTIKRDLNRLSTEGRLPVRKDGQFWRLVEGAKFELLPMKMNLPEAVALYLAGRLLSLTHDKRNEHVLSALRKLITAMPETIAQHQHALLDMLRERQKGQQDTSDTFDALALGWATHRKVRLFYTPPRKRTFECYFAPYLLEPSPIGRTIYQPVEKGFVGAWCGASSPFFLRKSPSGHPGPEVCNAFRNDWRTVAVVRWEYLR